jgi:hypothetical protein
VAAWADTFLAHLPAVFLSGCFLRDGGDGGVSVETYYHKHIYLQNPTAPSSGDALIGIVDTYVPNFFILL